MTIFVLLLTDSARFQILIWLFKFLEALFCNWVSFSFNTAMLVFQLGSQSLPEFVIIFEAEWSSYDGPDTGTHVRQYVNVGLKNKRKICQLVVWLIGYLAINCNSEKIIDLCCGSLTEKKWVIRYEKREKFSKVIFIHFFTTTAFLVINQPILIQFSKLWKQLHCENVVNTY